MQVNRTILGAGDNTEDYAQHTAGSTMNDLPNTRI